MIHPDYRAIEMQEVPKLSEQVDNPDEIISNNRVWYLFCKYHFATGAYDDQVNYEKEWMILGNKALSYLGLLSFFDHNTQGS